MKLFTSLALAALLSAGAAYAASTPTATPANSATPAATSSTKHHSAAHCEKEAKAKKLSGDEEKKFVKECTEGKTTN